GDAVNAFTGEGLSEEQRAFQAYVRRLFTWRKTQPVLQEGKLIHYYPLPADPFWSGVYVYGRMIPDDAVLVAMNKTNEIKDLPAGRFQDVLQGRTKGLDIVSGERVDLRAVVRVPPRSLVIIDLD
ncbi:MAG: cyclomaltodextrinase C-terminal domain-containing protein, partial [Hyphomonadaceae bacterium]|nr:cyclomaltodextrinase C-terminal domain-containing protein [Hyphomonadaceae bacterium]